MQRRRLIYLGALMLCMIANCAGCAQSTNDATSIFKDREDSSYITVTYQVVGEGIPDSDDMNDTIYKLQKRMESYSTEAIVYQEGTDRINIEIPDYLDVNTILEELGRPGALYFIAQTDSEGNSNYTYTYSTDETENPMFVYTLNKAIDELLEDGSIVVTGADIANAQAGTQKNSATGNSEYVVSLTLNESGTRAFADATTRAMEAGESIAIYYDGEFVSVPQVYAAITDGNVIITGQSTFEEAEHLASMIRIGSLKLELELVDIVK